jgi:hypothetical protein
MVARSVGYLDVRRDDASDAATDVLDRHGTERESTFASAHEHQTRLRQLAFPIGQHNPLWLF